MPRVSTDVLPSLSRVRELFCVCEALNHSRKGAFLGSSGKFSCVYPNGFDLYRTTLACSMHGTLRLYARPRYASYKALPGATPPVPVSKLVQPARRSASRTFFSSTPCCSTKATLASSGSDAFAG